MGRGPVGKALRLCWQDRKSGRNGADGAMNFADELQRFGLLLPPGRPTVVLAGTPEEIGRLYQTVDTALRQRPDLPACAGSGVSGSCRIAQTLSA